MKPQIATAHKVGEEQGRIYPCIIRPARYQGVYSLGQWHAWPVRHSDWIPSSAYGSDPTCAEFWNYQRDAGVPMVGVGDTPNKAKDDLFKKLQHIGRIRTPESRSPTDADAVASLAYYLDKNDARNG